LYQDYQIKYPVRFQYSNIPGTNSANSNIDQEIEYPPAIEIRNIDYIQRNAQEGNTMNPDDGGKSKNRLSDF
jgi:hypothetical protein